MSSTNTTTTNSIRRWPITTGQFAAWALGTAALYVIAIGMTPSAAPDRSSDRMFFGLGADVNAQFEQSAGRQRGLAVVIAGLVSVAVLLVLATVNHRESREGAHPTLPSAHTTARLDEEDD